MFVNTASNKCYFNSITLSCYNNSLSGWVDGTLSLITLIVMLADTSFCWLMYQSWLPSDAVLAAV